MEMGLEIDGLDSNEEDGSTLIFFKDGSNPGFERGCILSKEFVLLGGGGYTV